jgi:hypothetical protein
MLKRACIGVLATGIILTLICFTMNSSAQTSTVDLNLQVKAPFRFVVYGDTRFHDPADVQAANPIARVDLVQAIGEASPAFICITGDVVYNGNDGDDWKVWDSETSIWRERRIPVYPALGNHDLHGDPAVALGNYFSRFPELKGSRYYSVRAANALFLILDSSQPEATGTQGDWLNGKLDHVSTDVDFVFLIFHHPPYTSASDAGHSVRPPEQALAESLEKRQAHSRYRIVVFNGHVHNYEHHAHGGVDYFVSGGGAAHPHMIDRAPDDLFKNNEVNYHYLVVTVDHEQVNIAMNRLDLATGKTVWAQADSVKLPADSKPAVRAAGR